MNPTAALLHLAQTGNLRHIPADTSAAGVVDLSGNDYLGISTRADLRDAFMAEAIEKKYPLTAVASRLLASCQTAFSELENTLSEAYGRSALLFNSGYHANTGMIPALADKRTLVVADKLVHASIIDGIRLSGAHMERFRHNDYDHLRRILQQKAADYPSVVIVAESVYSMDGDRADIGELIAAKRSVPDSILYVDEAHAVGALGPAGLGLVAANPLSAEVDIVMGTMGKAIAASGAYAIMSEEMKQYMVNKARSFIFSTAMPPICAAWARFSFSQMLGMDTERSHLASLGLRLYEILGLKTPASHIAPLIVGSPDRAVELSNHLEKCGFHVLPIRTPTVPPGTDRLRFSLSAALSKEQLEPLSKALDIEI